MTCHYCYLLGFYFNSFLRSDKAGIHHSLSGWGKDWEGRTFRLRGGKEHYRAVTYVPRLRACFAVKIYLVALKCTGMLKENVCQNTGVISRHWNSLVLPLLFLLSWSFQRGWGGRSQKCWSGAFWAVEFKTQLLGSFKGEMHLLIRQGLFYKGSGQVTDAPTHKHTQSGSCFASEKGFLENSSCSSPTCAVWKLSLEVMLSSDMCYYLGEKEWLLDDSYSSFWWMKG